MPHTDVERPLPQNIEAERAILGAILLDNAALDEAARRLDPSHFFHDHHRRIYEQMLALDQEAQPIDLVSVTERLQRSGDLANAGGAAYVSQLMDGVPHISNVEHYAAIVREKALLRGLIHAAGFIQQQAGAAEDPAQEILERAQQSILYLGEGQAVSDLVPLRDLISNSLSQLEHLLTSPRSISGLPSGYPQLDGVLCGLHPGNVVILAARPSIGKTALALNIAENVARAGYRVGLFSLEMSREEILQRFIASVTRRDLRKLRAGGMGDDEWRALVHQLAEMGQLPIWVDDANPTTVAEIAAKARVLKRREGLALVIVDYLQLVGGAARNKYANRNEEVGASSRALKSMARQLKVPVIVLSQLTRASEREERRPQLSDLRESGAIEQDADVVLFIHRPKAFAVGEPPAERNRTELVIAKQRNGPTEVVKFIFVSQCTRFEELEPELYQEPA
ncbi:MAG TPA: replicative DNA helicase [Bryobacteraceae bacterium]|jgi:replicative DNA helicase|nr:replicative DNA helicase [Bryobacteraceae bacterium]